MNAEVRIIKCTIGGVSVDITGNQVNALATLLLFEQFDRVVGKNHLFKKTILLAMVSCGWADGDMRRNMNESLFLYSFVSFESFFCCDGFLVKLKAWAANEVQILGSLKGFLTSYCLRTMLLYFFNAYYQELHTVT